MARYRKISTVIWNDAKFRALSDDAQLLFLFILTHPHMTSVGAMRTSIDGLAAEKGWPKGRLSKAFREALSADLIEFDERASCLIVPKFLKHNAPESANVVTSWGKALELIPECGLKARLQEILSEFVAGLPHGYVKAFERLLEDLPEAFGKAMPNQEQEQEQEQEQDKYPHTPFEFEEELRGAWNAADGNVKFQDMTEKRRAALRARMRERAWRDSWRPALAKFPLKCFSDGADTWKPEIDWFLRPDTVTKILEGKYDWRKTNGKPSNEPGAGQRFIEGIELGEG